MDKKNIEGLIYFYENTTDVDDGIRTSTITALSNYLDSIHEAEAAAAKKRKSPNKSGVLQVSDETGEILAEYVTQKDALAGIGHSTKSGIGDALNGRTKTHRAYGFLWYFKDEYPGAKVALENAVRRNEKKD